MCLSGSPRPSGQDEQPQGWQQLLQTVDLALYGSHHLRSDDVAGAHLALRGVRGKIAAHHEECGLDVEKGGTVGLIGRLGHEQADVRVQLVDGAVALQTLAALAHALTADERRLSGIAGLSVYLHTENRLLII